MPVVGLNVCNGKAGWNWKTENSLVVMVLKQDVLLGRQIVLVLLKLSKPKSICDCAGSCFVARLSQPIVYMGFADLLNDDEVEF